MLGRPCTPGSRRNTVVALKDFYSGQTENVIMPQNRSVAAFFG